MRVAATSAAWYMYDRGRPTHDTVSYTYSLAACNHMTLTGVAGDFHFVECIFVLSIVHTNAGIETKSLAHDHKQSGESLSFLCNKQVCRGVITQPDDFMTCGLAEEKEVSSQQLFPRPRRPRNSSPHSGNVFTEMFLLLSPEGLKITPPQTIQWLTTE